MKEADFLRAVATQPGTLSLYADRLRENGRDAEAEYLLTFPEDRNQGVRQPADNYGPDGLEALDPGGAGPTAVGGDGDLAWFTDNDYFNEALESLREWYERAYMEENFPGIFTAPPVDIRGEIQWWNHSVLDIPPLRTNPNPLFPLRSVDRWEEEDDGA